MAFIAMNTNNPLGKRPYGQMGGLEGDFDFPGAPLPWRTPPELLSGNANKSLARPPMTPILQQASPWDAPESTMMLGDAAITSTQTVVPTANTTPVTTGAMPSGQPATASWFSQSSLISGLSNWEVLAGLLAGIALLKAIR